MAIDVNTTTSCHASPFAAAPYLLSQIHDATPPQASADDETTRAALASGRAALMSLVRARSPPRRVCLPLLFYAIPLLEASPATPAANTQSSSSGALFSSSDVQQLLSWVSECAAAGSMWGGAGLASCWGAGAGVGVGGAGAGAAGQGLAQMAAALGVSDRYAKDVQLALVRAVARAHVLENSGGGAGAGAGAGAGMGAAAAAGARQQQQLTLVRG